MNWLEGDNNKKYFTDDFLYCCVHPIKLELGKPIEKEKQTFTVACSCFVGYIANLKTGKILFSVIKRKEDKCLKEIEQEFPVYLAKFENKNKNNFLEI